MDMEHNKLHPRVGVGVIIRKEGKVLFGLRRGSHGAGLWATPGGHLEFGESFEDCAQREVLEETGLEVTVAGLGTVTNDIFEQDGKHYITLIMLADWVSGEPQNLEPEKLVEWRWCAWDDLPTPVFPSTQHAKEQGFSPFK